MYEEKKLSQDISQVIYRFSFPKQTGHFNSYICEQDYGQSLFRKKQLSIENIYSIMGLVQTRIQKLGHVPFARRLPCVLKVAMIKPLIQDVFLINVVNAWACADEHCTTLFMD